MVVVSNLSIRVVPTIWDYTFTSSYLGVSLHLHPLQQLVVLKANRFLQLQPPWNVRYPRGWLYRIDVCGDVGAWSHCFGADEGGGCWATSSNRDIFVSPLLKQSLLVGGGLINPFLFFWRVGYYDRWMMQCDTTTTRLLYWPLNKHDQSIKTCFLQKFQKSGCFESHGPIRKSLDEIFPKAKGSCLRKNLIRRQELILILLLGETHEIWQLLELGLTGKNRTTDFFEGFFLIR